MSECPGLLLPLQEDTLLKLDITRSVLTEPQLTRLEAIHQPGPQDLLSGPPGRLQPQIWQVPDQPVI